MGEGLVQGLVADDAMGLPLGVELGEGFLAASAKEGVDMHFAACGGLVLGVVEVGGPGAGADPEAVHFLPVVGVECGASEGPSRARLKPREAAADMK